MLFTHQPRHRIHHIYLDDDQIFFFLQKILKSNFNICIYFGEYFLEDTTQGTDKVQLNLKNLYHLSIFLRNYLLYGNGKQTEIKINDKNLY